MEFSWATISFIDIGLLSFGVIAIASGWIVKRQLDKQYNALQGQYTTLQQNFRTFQSTTDQRYNALRQENEALKAENTELRAGLDAVTREHKALQMEFHHFTGRYDELTERLIPLFEQLAREKLQGQF